YNIEGLWIFGIVVLGLIISVLVFGNLAVDEITGEKVSFSPEDLYLPIDCTDIEVTKVWESFFDMGVVAGYDALFLGGDEVENQIIIDGVEQVLWNHLTGVLNSDETDPNFDFNGDGLTNAVDISAYWFFLESPDVTDVVYIKIVAAVTERIGAILGNDNYIAEFDIDGDDIIDSEDLQKVERAMIGGIEGTIQSDLCEEFVAYKISGNEVEILVWAGNQNDFSLRAYHADVTQEYIDILNNLLIVGDVTDLFDVDSSSGISLTYLSSRSITDVVAESLFETIFNVGSDTWVLDDNVPSINFLEGNIMGFSNLDYSIEYLSYVLNDTGLCQPIWNSSVTECLDGDKKTRYYYENGTACGADPGDYGFGNATDSRCDYDGNNLIGTFGEIDEGRFDFDYEIDGDDINYTANYSGDLDVEFIDEDEGVIIVEFEHDFDDEDLDLSDVRIQKQGTNADYGYLIVNGLDADKTVRVDRINKSDEICIKDRANANLPDEDCDRSSEELIKCDDKLDEGFRCKVSGSYYIVSGLDHSSVREMIDESGSGGSSPSGGNGGTIPNDTVPDTTGTSTPPRDVAEPVSESSFFEDFDFVFWGIISVFVIGILVVIVLIFRYFRKDVMEKSVEKRVNIGQGALRSAPPNYGGLQGQNFGGPRGQ
ncbi:hypothetical protein CMI47_22740, partial [Candidatus Pacearchaeota archaeon]|nr:hypothetical protein [Candidatus Pacearchaeota archaeon]